MRSCRIDGTNPTSFLLLLFFFFLLCLKLLMSTNHQSRKQLRTSLFFFFCCNDVIVRTYPLELRKSYLLSSPLFLPFLPSFLEQRKYSDRLLISDRPTRTFFLFLFTLSLFFDANELSYGSMQSSLKQTFLLFTFFFDFRFIFFLSLSSLALTGLFFLFLLF